MLGNKAGFSFIEISVALLILGIITAVAVPGFFKKEPKQQRQLFAQKVNGLLQEAATQALLSGQIQKIAFDTAKKEFTVTSELKNKKDEQPKVTAKLIVPENLDIEQFYIQGVDEFAAKNSGKTTNEVWFYIIPDGMAQEVIINGQDTADKKQLDQNALWSLVLNPFTLRCTLYEAFQSPSW